MSKRSLVRMLALLPLIVTLVAGCVRVNDDISPQVRQMTGGNPRRGAVLIHQYGCGGCHTIPGVPGAYGLTGPSLANVGNRTYLAGRLINTPDNMLKWLKDPPSVDSMTDMPDVGLEGDDANHIAAYLYTLR